MKTKIKVQNKKLNLLKESVVFLNKTQQTKILGGGTTGGAGVTTMNPGIGGGGAPTGGTSK